MIAGGLGLFSFVMLVSGLFELCKIDDPGGASAGITVIATIAAFTIGYASIAGLLRLLAHHSVMALIVYRIAMAGLLVVLLAAGTIRAR